MQTIYLTPATINFTQIPNRLIASQIPLAAKAILNYLLSKPKDWLMRRTDLKRTLGLTGYAIQKGLSWLQSNGYAFFTRINGYTTWQFYDAPQTTKTATSPAIAECIENQYVENQHVLQITEKETNKKTTTGTIDPPAKIVVVSLENENQSDIIEQSELIYPDQLDVKQKKTARHILKTRLKRQEMGQELLFALAYAMTSKEIKSIPAYFSGLVNAANNGTFTTISSATSKPLSKPIIPLWVSPPANPTPKDKAKGFIGGLRDALRGG
jgi:hypothetical protein